MNYCWQVSYISAHCVTSPILLFSVDCFFQLEAEEDNMKTFTSPGYPTGYPAKSRCQWQIRTSEKNTILVNFPVFHTEDDCAEDFVAIYDSLGPDDYQAITQ